MTTMRVEQADFQALVEDLGRPGWAHLGVPHSGALDPSALSLANRLVGNREGQAGLEVLLGGLTLIADGSMRIALTGAPLSLRVGGRAAPWGTLVSVPARARIEVGPAPRSLRGWLAVAGGIDVPVVLGSRSTDTLGGLGPPPLQVGDAMRVGPAGPAPEGAGTAVPAPGPGSPVVLRLRLGPRDCRFTQGSIETMGERDFAVSAASSRVAIRLRGKALERRVSGELTSEGLVTGAVQVPGDGQPLVFLADHPTTGGYPVVGVVDPADLSQCAQLAPGDAVRFRVVR